MSFLIWYFFKELKKKKKNPTRIGSQGDICIEVARGTGNRNRLAANDSFCGAVTSMPRAGSGMDQPQSSPVGTKPRGPDYQGVMDVLGLRKLAQGRVD